MDLSEPVESTATIESIDDSPFTREQQQRAWAIDAAGEALLKSVSTGGSVVTSQNFTRTPGKWSSIVELAHYIVTGQTYGTSMDFHNASVVNDFVSLLINKITDRRRQEKVEFPAFMMSGDIPEDVLGFAIPLDGSPIDWPDDFPDFLKEPLETLTKQVAADRADASSEAEVPDFD